MIRLAVGARDAAQSGDVRAALSLQRGRSAAAGDEPHPTIPGIAEPRTDREQVGHLVLVREVGGEGRSGQHAGEAAAFIEAGAQRRFHAPHPGAVLHLRASVEAEDAIAVALRLIAYGADERGSSRVRARDVVPYATDVAADIGTGPIVVDYRRRCTRWHPHICRHCGP